MSKLLRQVLRTRVDDKILFLVGTTFFFAMNHYRGIVIDGPLYLLQVIHSWHPERFTNDVSFMYGNQDSFSLFSPLYGFFIKCFGASEGSKYLCLILQLTWATSMIFFIKVLAERYVKRDIALPLVILFFGVYASGMPNTQQNFLFFVDSYAVSRLASVSFAIGGLAFLLNHQKYWALGFFLLGSLMHPLMAGWCLAVWMFRYFPNLNKVVVVASLLLPFSIFIGKNGFAQYPEGWLDKPLYFAPSIDDIVRFLGYISFFALTAKKMVVDNNLKIILKAVALIVSIALYWWCWAGFGQHILLYQVQTFRIEWLCLIFALPLFVVIAFNRYQIYRDNGYFTTHDFALVCLGFNVFLPGHMVWTFIAGVVLFIRKESRLTLQRFQWMLILSSISTLLYQSYLNFYMLGANVPLIRKYLNACRIADSLVISNIILCAVSAIYLLKSKRVVLGLMFAAYCIFPILQLLPLAACFIWIKNFESRKKFLSASVIVALAEGLSSVGARITTIPLPKVFLSIFIVWILFAGSLVLMNLLKKRGLVSKIPLIIFSAACLVYAGYHWDERSIPQKNSELQIDTFVYNPVFPQIINPGKVLYYVKGYNEAFPRMQFLNGGYYDENSLTGALFYEGQYREGNRRRNLLYRKVDDGTHSDYAEYRMFVGSILSNRDSLIDRFSYLCDMNEIEYLVTDMIDAPFCKMDSLYLSVLEKDIALYSCDK